MLTEVGYGTSSMKEANISKVQLESVLLFVLLQKGAELLAKVD